MKARGMLKNILILMRNAVIVLLVNMTISLIVFYLLKMKEVHQYGTVLCFLGLLYFLPLAGSINSDAAIKDSVAFSAARSISSVTSDERRALEREDLSRDVATSIKLLVYGGITMLAAYFFLMDYINF